MGKIANDYADQYILLMITQDLKILKKLEEIIKRGIKKKKLLKLPTERKL